jgi:hypothetical protein
VREKEGAHLVFVTSLLISCTSDTLGSGGWEKRTHTGSRAAAKLISRNKSFAANLSRRAAEDKYTQIKISFYGSGEN